MSERPTTEAENESLTRPTDAMLASRMFKALEQLAEEHRAAGQYREAADVVGAQLRLCDESAARLARILIEAE